MAAPLAVCLSPIPWGGLWTSRHEICSEMAGRGWDLLFVDPPVNGLRLGRRSAEGRPVRPGVTVVQPPPHLPFGVLGTVPPLAGAVIERNARTYARFVAGTVAETHPGRRVDLLLNSFMPVHGYLVQDRLLPGVSLYHRTDELEQFPGWRPAYRLIEERVVAAADAVACVSEKVRAGIAAARPDAAVVPNGVAAGRFPAGTAGDSRLAGLDHPVAVMVGVFDRRIDQALLDAAASVASLVMVGRLDGVRVPPGATWLGPVDHAQVPGILAGSDVGLVCYRPGWAGDVLKIYEYLAAGLPVVSSHAPEPPEVRAAVDVETDPRRFADRIRASAAGRTRDGDAARRALAALHSWSVRVDQLLRLAGLAGLAEESFAR